LAFFHLNAIVDTHVKTMRFNLTRYQITTACRTMEFTMQVQMPLILCYTFDKKNPEIKENEQNYQYNQRQMKIATC
jgi:hypothetical protein